MACGGICILKIARMYSLTHVFKNTCLTFSNIFWNQFKAIKENDKSVSWALCKLKIQPWIQSLAICPTQLADGLLLKMLKYFEVMLNIFEFSYEKEIIESWLVYLNKFSWIIQSCFLTETENKVSASFRFLLSRTPMRRKKILT